MKDCLIVKINFLLLIIVMSFFFSCKKDNNDKLSGGKSGKLVFSVSGIIDPDNKNSKTASTIIDIETKHNKLPVSTINLNSIDLDIISESKNMESILAPSSTLKKSNLQQIKDKIASTSSPMGTGKTYRILLFNTNTMRIEHSVLATVGTAVEIDVVKNQEYRYYAYSYNNSELISNPDYNNLTIETPTDKDLLYASGVVNTSELNKPIAITFQHKVAQLIIELDTDRLFGDITNIDIEFSEENYLNKGIFSLENGTTSDIESYSRPINFSEVDTTQENVKIAKFYVADPTLLTSFSIKINAMDVKLDNNKDSVLIAPGATREIEFTPFTPSLGKKMIGKLKLWYIFKKLNILHVTGKLDNYSYAAQPRNLTMGGSTYNANPSSNDGAFNMINADRNYGELSNSKVRTKGFGHRLLYSNNHNGESGARLDTALHLTDKTIASPDIVIIATSFSLKKEHKPYPGDAEALAEYVNKGGVVFFMSDGVDNAYITHRLFFQILFNNNDITSVKTVFDGGAIYKLNNINDEILNGPFGDIRGEHWGEDATHTIAMQKIPIADITEYSSAQATNYSQVVEGGGVTMFKHKKRHFYWVGDGGFIALGEASGAHGSPRPGNTNWGSYANQPFATATAGPATVSNYYPYPYLSSYYEFFPVPRKFGRTGNGVQQYTYNVYNSTIFANIMSWAIINSTFYGINTGGLGNSYTDF